MLQTRRIVVLFVSLAYTAAVAHASAAGTALIFFDDFVSVPGSPTFAYPGSGGWTIESWIKPTSFNLNGQASSPIVGQISVGPGRDPYALEITETGTARLRVENASGSAVFLPAAIPLNQWSHVAGVYDRANARMLLYINGLQAATLNTSVVMESSATYPIVMGGAPVPPQRLFRGLLDECRVWNAARTPAQILTFHNKLVSPSSPNLVTYFRFDEGSGINTVDSTNGNIGILGFDGLGSDLPTWTPSDAPIIPEPASLLTMFLGLGWLARRR